MAKPLLYVATKSGRQRARKVLVERMADLYEADGKTLVASLRPPQNCCALGLCTASRQAPNPLGGGPHDS